MKDITLMDIISFCNDACHYGGAPIHYMEEFNNYFENETPDTIAMEILGASPEFTLEDEYFWYDSCGCLTSGSAAEAITACIDDLDAVVQEMIAEKGHESLPFAERWQAEAEEYELNKQMEEFLLVPFKPIQMPENPTEQEQERKMLMDKYSS